MGFLDLFKRTPREFHVIIGNPWTINGKPTQGEKPKDVLNEIYDIAVYFPITITVEGPREVHHIEMDEHGDTHPLKSVSKSAEPDDHHISPEEKANVTEVATQADIAAEEEDDAAPEGRIPTGLQGLLRRLSPQRKKIAVIGASLGAAVVTIGVAGTFIFGGNISSEAQAINAGEGSSWQTAIPETTKTSQALDEKYKQKLWSVEPGDAESASWFKAGVVTIDKHDIDLLDHHTGEQIASHTVQDSVNLNEDIEWVAEFYTADSPAVGLRVADTFIALTPEGETQEWSIPANMRVSVYGKTPVIYSDTSEENAADTEYQALLFGKKQPVELVVNPAMSVRAVDDEWIIQLDLGTPRVALNPVDRDNADHEPHAVGLQAPHGESVFVRHLDAGHGYAMALWEVEGDLYLGIHSLTGDTKGQVTAFLPAPFTEDEATGWAIGNGMEMFLVGPYGISMTTGELLVFYDEGDITRAYGPAAVAGEESQQFFIVDNKQYNESERIIGYSNQGIILVRLIDGSVAAYGDFGGIA